uniref:Uncharacterized protein n=1 Tax=Plectus sambesii TaxID=2011161 RepID=A0A914WU55_9BILA
MVLSTLFKYRLLQKQQHERQQQQQQAVAPPSATAARISLSVGYAFVPSRPTASVGVVKDNDDDDLPSRPTMIAQSMFYDDTGTLSQRDDDRAKTVGRSSHREIGALSQCSALPSRLPFALLKPHCWTHKFPSQGSTVVRR